MKEAKTDKEPAEPSQRETLDESELWRFAERTARAVAQWPAWKREGWYVLDRVDHVRSRGRMNRSRS